MITLAAPFRSYYGRPFISACCSILWIFTAVLYLSSFSTGLGIVAVLPGLFWAAVNAQWLFHPCEVRLDLANSQLRYRTLLGERYLSDLGSVRAIECKSFGLFVAPFRVITASKTISMNAAPSIAAWTWAKAVRSEAAALRHRVVIDMAEPWDPAKRRIAPFVFSDTRQ